MLLLQVAARGLKVLLHLQAKASSYFHPSSHGALTSWIYSLHCHIGGHLVQNNNKREYLVCRWLPNVWPWRDCAHETWKLHSENAPQTRRTGTGFTSALFEHGLNLLDSAQPKVEELGSDARWERYSLLRHESLLIYQLFSNYPSRGSRAGN